MTIFQPLVLKRLFERQEIDLETNLDNEKKNPVDASEPNTSNMSVSPLKSLRLITTHVPVDAMLPANEDVHPPQAHQDGIPVVVVAQQRGDEEGEEDWHRPGEKQPRETHLFTDVCGGRLGLV